MAIICTSTQIHPSPKTRIGLCIASGSAAYIIKNQALPDDQKEKISTAIKKANHNTCNAICQLCETNFFCAAVESHQRIYRK